MQPSKWRTILQKTTRDPQALLAALDLAPGPVRLSRSGLDSFPLRVPRAFLDRIRPGDIHDPLLRQVLPLAEEDEVTPGYTSDPLREHSGQPVPGLLHKYHGRALLIVTGACAIHCRYCFRRHFPYAHANASVQQWRPALDHLRRDGSIREIILSGGDPLMAANDKLEFLLEELSGIAHIQRLRIHTRIPIVLPERIDDGLLALLEGTRFQKIIVVHVNHPDELDDGVAAAIAKLRDVRILLMNQSVLLKEVNDSITVLQELSEKLFSIGVIPYYLHMLDPVQGAAHFAVPDNKAREIMDGLRAVLPGYLVPRLVREIPGNANKLPLETM
ncbi:MAG: EF-P beta-lysylation protein EpmB [Gammaproteobacteria bacterium]